MTVARFAISLDARLAGKIRKAAGRQPLSTWLADAADRKLRAEGLLRVVAEWEAEHGKLSVTEATPAKKNPRRRPRK